MNWRRTIGQIPPWRQAEATAGVDHLPYLNQAVFCWAEASASDRAGDGAEVYLFRQALTIAEPGGYARATLRVASNAELQEATLDRAPVRRTYRGGVILQLANPKNLVFFMVILPPFIDLSGNVLTQVLILGVTSQVIEILVLLFYGSLGARAGQWVRRSFRPTSRMPRVVMRWEEQSAKRCAPGTMMCGSRLSPAAVLAILSSTRILIATSSTRWKAAI